MKYDQTIIGKRIKEERVKNKYTQKHLGSLVKVTGKQISNYESNKAIPPLEILERLSNIFHCEVGYLLGEDDYSNQTKLNTLIQKETTLNLSSISQLKKATYNPSARFSNDIDSNDNGKVKALNQFINSKYFISLIDELSKLIEMKQKDLDSQQALIDKYGQENITECLEYAKTHSIEDPTFNAIDAPNYFEQIYKEHNQIIENEDNNSFQEKVLKYELNQMFNEIIKDILH